MTRHRTRATVVAGLISLGMLASGPRRSPAENVTRLILDIAH